MHTNEVTGEVVGAAIQVHKELGPGLLESAYESCLCAELGRRDVRVKRQVTLPVVYRGQTMDVTYRLDLVVEEKVIVEVKAVASVTDVHRAQLLSYLRLSGLNVGLLLNFHTLQMRDGIVRMLNLLEER